jgi:hypothetical protein
MLQLNPSMVVRTPNGRAIAILVINHGSQLPLEWLVINDKTQEFESWRTQDIKHYLPLRPSWLDASPPDAPSSFTTVQSSSAIL